MPFLKSRRARITVLVGVALAALIAVGVVFAQPASALEGQVVRVVDGDTLVVRADGESIRVRVLNIDTPESVDQSQSPECLGHEATEFTKALLPPGTRVTLTFDEEREDRYGRTLARVALQDGRSLATELARAGLGVPIVVGPNRAGIRSVRAGLAEAENSKRGFFDAGQKCTFPAHQQAIQKDVAAAEKLTAGTTIASAAAAAAAALALVEAHRPYDGVVTRGRSEAIRAIKAGRMPSELSTYRSEFDRLEEHLSRLETVVQDMRDEERRTRDEAERRRQQEQDRQQQQDQGRSNGDDDDGGDDTGSADDDDDGDGDGEDSSGDGNRAPCRRYAPGGKTWEPMPCP